MSAFVPVKELIAGIFLGDRGGIAMLRAYFDDSGTHGDSEIVSVGGLVGSPAQWDQFEAAWRVRLADPLPGYGKPALKMFHLSHCNARDGEFAGYSEGECDAVTHDFRQILANAKLFATASVIDKRAWDELVVGEVRKWIGPALDVCAENCLSEVIKIAGPHPEGDKVAVWFDRGMWTERLRDVTEGSTYQMGRPHIVSVGFSQVQYLLGLQGADIPATENYWHGIRILRDGFGAQPRPHMQHYLRNMIAEGFMIGRDQIVSRLPELVEHARQLADEQ